MGRNRKKLPETVFQSVDELLKQGKRVGEACKAVGISRCAYYTYKGRQEPHKVSKFEEIILETVRSNPGVGSSKLYRIIVQNHPEYSTLNEGQVTYYLSVNRLGQKAKREKYAAGENAGQVSYNNGLNLLAEASKQAGSMDNVMDPLDDIIPLMPYTNGLELLLEATAVPVDPQSNMVSVPSSNKRVLAKPVVVIEINKALDGVKEQELNKQNYEEATKRDRPGSWVSRLSLMDIRPIAVTNQA